MSIRRTLWCLLLLGLSGGCPSDCDEGFYVSQGNHWRFAAEPLQSDPYDRPGLHGLQHDEPLLAGTRWCPAIDCIGDCPEGWSGKIRADCYEASVEGPGQLDGGCLEVTGSGELLWRFDPIPCEHPGLFFPQQVSLRGVGVAEVRGKLVSYLDTMAKDYLFAGTGEFAADLTPPVDAALLKLAADQPVHLAVNLWAGDRRVAWSGDGAVLEVEVIRGPAPTATLGQRATALVQVPAGSEAALWLVLGPTRVALGHVRGVPPGALEQLELVVGYADHPEGAGSRVPLAARAVARDAEGDLVYGAPAEWSVLAGSFAFSPAFFFHEGANNDYVLLFDSAADDDVSPWCFPTPSSGAHAYTGRISARVAGLTAEVDLAWTYAAGGKTSPDSLVGDFSAARPGPNCEGPGFDGPTACNCASTTDSGPTIVLLALLAIGAARRRRRG